MGKRWDDKAGTAPVRRGQSVEPSGQSSQHLPATGLPNPCNSQKTPPLSANLRTGIFLESEVTNRTSSSARSSCNSCSPRLLKLRDDSVIIHHHSYFQVCKWCGGPALIRKLTPISFCKRSSCNRAPFPRRFQSNYKAWFSCRVCLARWFHFTFRLTFAISDVTRVFLLLKGS